MANEVYVAARAELTALVSLRAAERMLDGALAEVAVSSDAVTPRQMRALVAGPVQRDLRRVVPPDVSKQLLEKVMRRLRAMSVAAEPAPVEDPAEPSPAPDARTTAPAATTPPASTVERRPQPSDGTRAEPAETATSHSLERVHLDDAGVERLARSFARLDDVVGVSVVNRGTVRFHRGEAIAADAAAALVPAAAAAWQRGGAWRSYTLEHDRGHLFIVPVGNDHLVVVGRTGFNLGAVLTALATFEEEL